MAEVNLVQNPSWLYFSFFYSYFSKEKKILSIIRRNWAVCHSHSCVDDCVSASVCLESVCVCLHMF